MTLYPRGKVSQATKAIHRRLGDSLFVLHVHDSSMLQRSITTRPEDRPLDMPGLLEVLAHSSARPRYAFMVLNLVVKAADANGRAGPWVIQGGAAISLRDWLCDALMPMGHRDPRRQALMQRVRKDLETSGVLPRDAASAERAIDDEVRARMRVSGKTNVSRAVSDLVRAGMLSRHYEGYRVDHHNRGAQRQAVYTLTPVARRLLSAQTMPSAPRIPVQHALPF